MQLSAAASKQARSAARSGAAFSPRPSSGRRRFAVACQAQQDAPAAPAAPKRREKLKLLKNMSALVEVNDLARRYEVWAGRSAMLGVSVATAFELLAGRNVFERVDSQDAELFAAFGLACVTLAAVAAAMSQGRKNLGRRVLEPVIASLTSVQRSAASVTGQQVDSAVDYVLDGSRDINRLAKTSFVDDQLI